MHQNRGDWESREKEMFDRAFSLAYKDMSTHTVAYLNNSFQEEFVKDNSTRCTRNKKRIRDTLNGHLQEKVFGKSLSRLKEITSSEQFDNWHRAACESVMAFEGKVTGLEKKQEEDQNLGHSVSFGNFFVKKGERNRVFSCGQAQKLINMMVKYLYVYYQCEGRTDLEKLSTYAHPPIDRFLLKGAFGADCYNGTPWSQIRTYSEYYHCKQQIDQIAQQNHYANGFLWELAKWPFTPVPARE